MLGFSLFLVVVVTLILVVGMIMKEGLDIDPKDTRPAKWLRRKLIKEEEDNNV